MIRTLAAAALLFGLMQEKPAQEFDGAKAAKALLDRVEAKVASAKSVRFAFKVTMSGEMMERSKEESAFEGEVLLRNPGEVRMQMILEKRAITVRSDGKIVILEGESKSMEQVPKEPKALVDMLRKSAALGFFAFQPEETGISLTPLNLMFGGREKVEGVETQIISYDLKAERQELSVIVRAWIDPVRLTVLKREYDLRGFVRLKEELSKFVYDEPLPGDEFALQSARAVRAAVEGQIMRSVELYALYLGRLPERLEDLDSAPKDAAFWPEGGFWIGGKRPADLKYSVTAGVAKLGERAVAAPVGGRIAPTTDRLKNYYASRLRLHLVMAGVVAWHQSYMRLPEKIEHLSAKPEGIEFWPDGGFISGSQLKDPGGEPLTFAIERGAAVLSCAKKNERLIREKVLTPEEATGLKSGAFPTAGPIPGLEAALNNLGADDLPAREKAEKDLMAMGPRALLKVEERLKSASGEAAARLKTIRIAINAMPQSWRAELRPLATSFRPGRAGGGELDANERHASTMLKVLTTAQADFRSNDRDGNREMDFWVKDVAGFYGIVGATGSSTECHPAKEGETTLIKLIEPSMAAADTTEGRWEYPALNAKEPEASSGYFVAALKKYKLDGEEGKYDSGAGRNSDMFGFVAYPETYGVTGRLTFIVNEDNVVWSKDLGPGGEVDTFPASPAAEGWSKVD